MPTLTKTELKRYSISRALSLATLRGNPNAGTGLEADASRIARQAWSDMPGLNGDGIWIPGDLLWGDTQQRTLSPSTYALGGALVTEDRDSIFARYLFPQSVVFGLGANFLGGLSVDFATGIGNFAIPAITGAAEGQWLNDGEGATDQSGSLTVALKQATPKRVVAIVVVSNQLLAQTGPAAEAALWKVLMAGVAAAIDRAALAGTGGAKPLGLLYASGVPTIALGANGGAITLAKLNSVEAAPVAANVPLLSGGYALSPNARKTAKATPTAAGTSTFLLQTNNGADRMNGYRAFATPLLPDDLSKGSGSGLGSLIFGADWSMLHVCHWGPLNVVADPFTQALAGRTVLTVTALLDVVCPNLGAFAKCVDVLDNSASLPTGPSYDAQASTAAGTVTVSPLSQLHTEQVTVTGLATTRTISIKTAGLNVGAKINVLCLFPLGATNGTEIVIENEDSTVLFTWTRSGDEENALFKIICSDGAGTLVQEEEVIPAFPAP